MHFEELVETKALVLLYFTGPNCSVCHVLRPKVEALVQREFPKVAFRAVSVDQEPELAASFLVFTVPTVIFFAEGKETFRKVRAFSLDELQGDMSRIYRFFED
ncbi:co-chaperone YbbN [Prolixibacter sp. SD074]|jgi:thioredoxin-like negative regulator of GroEL|uniref:thioredoxin family protein n=1 Tax=Prolixibacter sp. SD074 TaxID=2652391 RepID=UPI00128A5FA8|nr:thioredoxin family protein [Prolixibacter sp. SD074]GET30062.1 thioredoxin-like protein YdfQ [Prolixibacter sp. SD074]